MSANDTKGGTPAAGAGGDEEKRATSGESRREFMKKLPYVAPVIQSFVLSDTVYGDQPDYEGGGRARGRVSKVKKDKKDKDGKTSPPPPPPPPPASSGR